MQANESEDESILHRWFKEPWAKPKKKKSIYNSSEKLKQQKNVQEKARTCQTTRNFGLLWFHMELKLDATQACWFSGGLYSVTVEFPSRGLNQWFPSPAECWAISIQTGNQDFPYNACNAVDQLRSIGWLEVWTHPQEQKWRLALPGRNESKSKCLPFLDSFVHMHKLKDHTLQLLTEISSIPLRSFVIQDTSVPSFSSDFISIKSAHASVKSSLHPRGKALQCLQLVLKTLFMGPRAKGRNTLNRDL